MLHHFFLHCFRQQDEELDELSKSVERIGGVGLTIHDELVAQVSKIDIAISISAEVRNIKFCFVLFGWVL